MRDRREIADKLPQLENELGLEMKRRERGKAGIAGFWDRERERELVQKEPLRDTT